MKELTINTTEFQTKKHCLTNTTRDSSATLLLNQRIDLCSPSALMSVGQSPILLKQGDSSEIAPEILEQGCIHQWFELQVEKAPEAVAVIGSAQTLTYGELNARANQLAHYLKSLGVEVNELVAISTERSPEMLIAFLAVLKAGAAYVPIDPAYPLARRAYQLQDCQARILLTQQHLKAALPDLTDQQVICLDTDWATVAQWSSQNLPSQSTPDDLAYVIYTSGSTGNPKGVLISHRGVVNHSAAMSSLFELQQGDRVLQFSSMSFDIIVEELYPSLISGATIVLRTEDIAASTRQFLNFVQTYHINVLNLPTAFWHEWVNGMTLLGASVPDCVRLVVVGGEKAARTAYLQWQRLTDLQSGTPPRWFNTYGPTEATVTTTVYDPAASPLQKDWLTIPIGKPIANATVYVLDEALQPVPMGTPGELHIGGPGVARGYLNLPEKTALKFISDPFSSDPDARLYKTGDLVRYLPDGNLEFIGRTDFQVKIRGFRIELSEIEVFLEQHEAVQQAIVIAQESPAGQPRLVAYWVAQSEQSASNAALHSFLIDRLPSYMLPAAFVQLESFPLTPNGKVDRRALPAPQLESGDRPITPPRTSTEIHLVQIWETVLNVQPIGIEDNFFELGGHSLLVARLFDQIESRFHCNLPLTTIFKAPTLTQLAAQIDALPQSAPNSAQNPALVCLKAGTAGPPLFLAIAFAEDTEMYLNLAQGFAGDRPIYGLRTHDANNHLIPFTRIPDAAAFLIEQMRQVQPQGPYLLGGQCGGGTLAFEMAQQLQRHGETVALLALLDTVDGDAIPLKGQQQTGLSTFNANLKSYLKALKTRWFLPLVERYLDWQLPFASGVSRCLSQVRRIQYYGDRQLPLPEADRSICPFVLFDFAFEQYRPQGLFTGHFVLLRATQGNGEPQDEPYLNLYEDALLGWEKRVQGSVNVYDVPGGHSTLLASPHSEVVAGILHAATQRALSNLEDAESTGMLL